MKADKIRELDSDELRRQALEIREQNFRLRFQLSMGQTDWLRRVPDHPQGPRADSHHSARSRTASGYRPRAYAQEKEEGEVSHGRYRSSQEEDR